MATPIPKRTLGRNGPLVPALGLGLAGLSIGYGPAPPDAERFKVLDRAVELGATFWDTSDFYGDNEDMLAQWFKTSGNREQIFLATKGGLSFDPVAKQMACTSTEEYMRQACEASLKRLGADCVDLYYAHRVNPETPIEDTMQGMAQLQKDGKIKYIGLSSVTASTLRRACKIAQVTAVQMEYSPFVLDIEKDPDFLPTCRELGIAIVCYSPIGRGMLTEAFVKGELDTNEPGNVRSRYSRFSDENFTTNAKAVGQFKLFADQRGCTSAQLALAWLLEQGDDIFPIPGTKKVKYLEENCGAACVQLSKKDEAAIRQFVENVQIGGSRSVFEGESYTSTVEETPSR